METLTLQQSTIRGVVLGKAVFCTLRGSPGGLRLAAGNYLLRAAQNNPVYGLVMPIELPGSGTPEQWSWNYAKVPAGAPSFDYLKAPALPPGKVAYQPPADPSAEKFVEPVAHKATDPAAIKLTVPSAVKMADPAAIKYADPAAIKYVDPAAIKYADPVAIKYAAPAASKAVGMTDPASLKYGPAAAVATLVPPHAPAIKFDTAAGQVNQPVVISDRSIAGNAFQATAGFGDLVEVVQRAGAVKLVVV